MARRSVETTKKKRKWVLPVVIVGSVIALLFIACLIILGIMAKKELGFSKGRYLAGRDGVSMVVTDDAPDGITDPEERERYMSPVVMSNRTERELFKNLETGDKILFVHGGIKESYPAGTGVYAVFKLKKGSRGDIPQKLLNDLTAMGWLESAVDMNADFPDWGLNLSVKDVTPTGLTLVCTKNGGNPTGELICGTDYRLLVFEDGMWKHVPTVVEEYCWDDIGYPITEGKVREFELSWEWLYGKLPTGTYRLAKDFMDWREAGDYDEATYWVEFKISE
ncbi:MAG: hypothetical protein J6J38_06840 [Lachnospiraceae bacterium]|nr:hypothetical protein [Lachnospiraceae bacterium]